MKYLFLLTLFALSTCIHAQNQTTNFHGTKSLALGNASVNLSGIYSVYSNPAGLSSIEALIFNVSSENKFEISDLTAVQFSLAKRIEDFGVLGLSFTSFGIKEYTDQKVSLAYAKKLFDKLSIGAQFVWLQTRIYDYGMVSTFTFELGMQTKISEDLKLGFHLFSPYGKDYTINNKIPGIFSLGISYLASKKLIVHCQLEKHQNYPLQLKIGLSYQILQQFSLSFGMFTETRAANMSGGFCYLINSKFSMDAAVSYNQVLGISSGLGLSYHL